MNLIIQATRFAHSCHAGQYRKFTKEPYINHPMWVASQTMLLPYATKKLVAAAILHDVVEDCGVNLQEIHDNFGGTVARYVFGLTNVSIYSHMSLPRAARKEIDRQHISVQPNEVKCLKLIDRCHNLRDFIDHDMDFVRKCYGRESRLLYEAIGEADIAWGTRLLDLVQEAENIR